MVVLGLHFGHDASVAVLIDGNVTFFYEKERYVRIKHAIGIDGDDVEYVLSRCGLKPSDIDMVAVTSTQGFDYVFFDDRLCFDIGDHEVTENYFYKAPMCFTGFRHVSGVHHDVLFKQYHGRDYSSLRCFPSLERYCTMPAWEAVGGGSLELQGYKISANLSNCNQLMHANIVATLLGRKIPGVIVNHHMAHACYAYYESDNGRAGGNAAVFTVDGASGEDGYNSGLMFYGADGIVQPIVPHFLSVGPTYEWSSVSAGFDLLSGPGKLMGLSAYGKPLFHKPSMVSGLGTQPIMHQELLEAASAGQVAYGLSGGVGDILSDANVHYAASVQKWFEESVLGSVHRMESMLRANGLQTTHLCLAGGAALNCPTNSRIYNETVFHDLFVPPGCADQGLSIGSAYHLYYNLLGNQLVDHSHSLHGRAFYGEEYKNPATNLLDIANADNPIGTAIECLNRRYVVAVFHGGSEIGPRALGHRSILAQPSLGMNDVVNGIKGREKWRPLAPAVSHIPKYCDGIPQCSPFMLMNGRVVNRDSMPAATHVDLSSRVQSVVPESGPLYDIVSAMGCVINTSFNGPGEPIVQAPSEAVACVKRRGIHYLLMGGTLYKNSEAVAKYDEERS